MDNFYEIYKYLRDSIIGMAPTHKATMFAWDIIGFEEEMEWEAWERNDLWMDHEEELVDHELGWMTHYYSAVLEHSIDDECAKFQI